MARRRSTITHDTIWRGNGRADGHASEDRSGEDRPREDHADEDRRPLEFLGEEPLLIRVNDHPYLVVMRTPGGEPEQAAGFCLGEGIVDAPEDIARIGYDELLDPNIIDLWLAPERHEKVRDLLGRQRFVSQTSCGICGKQLIEDLHQNLMPAEDGFAVATDRIVASLALLDEQQVFYEPTRASHAALLLDAAAAPIAFAEDVGRHSALDKAIGQAFLARRLPEARVVVLSSRNSYELIQKAARARVPVIVSKSRPTALAVALAKSLNMTLAFPSKGELVIVCGEGRLLPAAPP